MTTVRDDLAELAVELSEREDQLEAEVKALHRERYAWRDTVIRLASTMSVQGQVEVALRIGGADNHTIDHMLDTLCVIRKEPRE